jgi:hypothetical protein
MFRKITTSVTLAAFLSATACGQQLALVQGVDLEQRQIVVKIGDVPCQVAADRVELRDQDGMPAALADFVAEQKVLVTRNGDVVTRIQRANGARQLFARRADTGSITGVDRERGTITLKVGDREYTVDPAAAKLLDRNGKPAQAADFLSGEQVEVTLDRTTVTQVRKTI